MSPEAKTGKETPPFIDKEFLRQNLYLAEQAAVGGLPVVPGESWAEHYTVDSATRTALLQGLLNGTVNPSDAAPQLKPNGLIYDVREVTTNNLSAMLAKVADMTAKVKYYDYNRYADFVANMGGTGIDVQTADAIYDRIAQSRIRGLLYDSYGYTGRQQITTAMRREATEVTTNFSNLPSGERIFEALKLSWIAQDLRIIPTPEASKIITQLSDSERVIFSTLEQPYRQFVQTGTAESFSQLTSAIKSALELPQKENQETQEQTTEETEESEEQKDKQEEEQEMKDYTDPEDKDKSEPTPTPDNPSTPPSYRDNKKIDKERPSQEGVYYYITPSGTSTAPMLGHYAANKKSHYNPNTRNWEQTNQLTAYNQAITGTERQTIIPASQITPGLIPIEVPTNYALDASSLKATGNVQLLRNQKGCFFLKSRSRCTFSVDFLKEPAPFMDLPIAEDRKQLYQGNLSNETENFMGSLTGSNLDKAMAVRKYLQTHHFYPGEGNLDVAQHVKYNLSKTPKEAFFQAIDTSKYLECQLTHTLFVAMIRKLGIPARVVEGDHIDKVVKDKTQIDSTTKHMWAEVWDGAKWVRIDATPQPEHKKDQKQDQNKDKDQEQNQQGQQADDNGMDQEESGEESEEGSKQGKQGQQDENQQGQQSGKQGQQGQPGQSGQSSGQPGTEGKPSRQGKPDMKFNDQAKSSEATDQQMQSGQQNLQQAQETMKRIQQKKDQLDQQIKQADSFKQLENLKSQTTDPDLFEEMKAELEDKIKALEQAKKDQLKENLVNMAEDGFIENEQMEQLINQIDKSKGDELDQVNKQVEKEGALHHEYLQIRARVEAKVEEKFEYLMSILPTEPTMVVDEDLARRKGILNRRAMMKPINLIMGTVKSPRVFEEAVKPLFLTGIAVDFSRSVMTMDPAKRRATEDLLVFVLELFDKVVQTHGYMRYALTAFHDSVFPIKGYDQDYSSLEKYTYPDRTQASVKARLMRVMRTQGGTDILPALQYCAAGLNQQVAEYPDYMSAFYFIGDGEDSRSDPRFGGDPRYYLKIKRFVSNLNPQNGFGEHDVKRAIFMGSEQEKKQLSNIFGEENTSVCADFDQLVDMFLDGLAVDVQTYMTNRI